MLFREGRDEVRARHDNFNHWTAILAYKENRTRVNWVIILVQISELFAK